MDGTPRPAKVHVQHGLRRAQHRATVIGGRGYEDGTQPRLPDDPAVEEAVQGEAACEAQAVDAVLAAGRSDHVQDGFLDGSLERPREVVVHRRERLAVRARRSEDPLELAGERPPLPAVVEVQVGEVETILTVREKPYDPAELLDQGIVPVPGEGHHLALVVERPEPEVLGHGRVEDPQRVEEVVLVDLADPLTLANEERQRADVPERVGNENQGTIEVRREEGVGCVREMVLDEPYTR